MPHLRLIPLLLLLAGPALGADPRVINGGAKAQIAIELDREEWSALEPITGKVILQVTEVRDSANRALDAVRLNNPRLNIVFPPEMAVVPLKVTWRTVFIPTIKVGHRYELQFTLRVDDEFEKLVKKDGQSLALFKPGRHALAATLDSPARPPWEDPPQSLFIELYQQFASASKPITVGEAAGGKMLSGDEVKKAFGAAQGPLKHQIVTFYATRKVLSRQDLLAAIADAEGKPKAELAALHLSLNYPASDLSFFTAVGESLKVTGHGAAPLYLLVRPQQRVRFDFDLAEVHRLRVATLDTVVATKKQVDFEAPRGEGVYEMYDDAHKKPWGWMLVIADQQRDAAGGLRPDTRDLSAKVAQALFKQDAKALEALSAPGFQVNETIKKTRFKLADGDVRYEESTGSSNKVKTRMKINSAPPGKEPVFARELWLDFVRVGEDLRLSNAMVWDIEN
jgi:hypothetical protein